MKKWSNSQRRHYNETIRSRKADKTIVEIMIVYPIVLVINFFKWIWKGLKWCVNKVLEKKR